MVDIIIEKERDKNSNMVGVEGGGFGGGDGRKKGARVPRLRRISKNVFKSGI